MHYIDFGLFNNNLSLLKEYDEEIENKEQNKMENLFNRVLYDCNNIELCEDLSIDEMFSLLDNISSLVDLSERKMDFRKNMINIINNKRHKIRRLI